MPTTEDKVRALEIAFVEMAKEISKLGDKSRLSRMALASQIEHLAKGSGEGVETAAKGLAKQLQ